MPKGAERLSPFLHTGPCRRSGGFIPPSLCLSLWQGRIAQFASLGLFLASVLHVAQGCAALTLLCGFSYLPVIFALACFSVDFRFIPL